MEVTNPQISGSNLGSGINANDDVISRHGLGVEKSHLFNLKTRFLASLEMTVCYISLGI